MLVAEGHRCGAMRTYVLADLTAEMIWSMTEAADRWLARNRLDLGPDPGVTVEVVTSAVLEMPRRAFERRPLRKVPKKEPIDMTHPDGRYVAADAPKLDRRSVKPRRFGLDLVLWRDAARRPRVCVRRDPIVGQSLSRKGWRRLSRVGNNGPDLTGQRPMPPDLNRRVARVGKLT